LNKRDRAPGLPISAALKTVRERPGGCDSALIRIVCGMRERSVTDMWQIMVCWETAKLIEPCRPDSVVS
jgi:hypothetical protein